MQNLGDRMKEYERSYDISIINRIPIIIRLDGKNFSKWTKMCKFAKPFDEILSNQMANAMKETAEKSKTDNDLRFSNLTKTGLVKEALVDLGATRPNAGLLLNEIKLSKVVVGDDGKISNAEDLFKTVLTDHKSLFGKPILKGKDPIIPDGAPEGYITKDKFLAMTPQERTANIAKVNESSPHWDKK